MLMSFKAEGDFFKGDSLLDKLRAAMLNRKFEQIGVRGVEALRSATPVDTGLTASSWYYKITHIEGGVNISFHNSNVNKGVPIAIILHYGHGTRNGGWVEGRNYINSAIQPVFDKLLSDAWKEVVNIK